MDSMSYNEIIQNTNPNIKLRRDYKSCLKEMFYFRAFAFTIFIVLIKLNCYSEGFITRDFSKRNIVDSIPKEYRKIVSGLNLSYVRYYTELKRTGGNLVQRGWTEIDSIFKHDSTLYWESYQDFFNQDRRFLDWLFTFRNDYNNSDLWNLGHNPKNSYLGEWYWNWNNSLAAITLLLNFLEGDGFRFYECGSNNWQKCTREQYRKVKKFLNTHNSDDIETLRKAWKTNNMDDEYKIRWP